MVGIMMAAGMTATPDIPNKKFDVVGAPRPLSC